MNDEAARFALYAAETLGWHVFPVRHGCAKPPLVKWTDNASDDPEQIKAWAREHPGCNWGVNCGDSGLAVVDVDDKSDKAGSETLIGHELDGQVFPATRIHKTPSGYHYIYAGGIKTSVEGLGRGLDTRSIGGYIVLPGSVKDGRPYTVEKDRPICDVPAWISESLKQVKEKDDTATTPSVELDLPHNLLNAVEYLQTAPPALEGAGGDARTFSVIARLRDMGVSPGVALDLMSRFYNGRCQPPWDFEDLQTKVANAYKYASNPVGTDTAAAAFTPVEPDEPSHIFADQTPKPIVGYNMSDIQAWPDVRRGWILQTRLCRQFVTLTIAGPGTGKSGESLVEAAAIASGHDIAPYPVAGKDPLKVLVYNNEDSIDEMRQKILSIFDYHAIDWEYLKNITLASGESNAMVLLTQERDSVNVTKNVRYLIEFIKENDISVAILDPVVSLHDVAENDNGAIDKLGQVCTTIAQETNCALNLVHHSRKRNKSDGVGDMEIGRGASALAARARIIHTLATMNEDEARIRAISKAHIKNYVRMDMAKNNLCAAVPEPVWLEKASHVRPHGESFMVMQKADLVSCDGIREEDRPLIEALAGTLQPGETYNLNETVEWCVDSLPNLAAAYGSKPSFRRSLQRMLEHGVEVDGKHLRYFTTAKKPGTNGTNWIVCNAVGTYQVEEI